MKIFFICLISLTLPYLGGSWSHAMTCGQSIGDRPRLTFVERANALFTDGMALDLTQRLRPMVEKILRQENLSQSDRNQAIFNLYISARLELLPSHISEKVNRTVREGLVVRPFTLSFFKRDISGGAGEVFGFWRLYISMPDYLLGTIIDYAVRAHEIEHVIQIYSTGTGSSTQYLAPSFATHRHAVEAGAMRSEGTFMSLFPKEEFEVFLDPKTKNRRSQLAQKIAESAFVANAPDQYLQMSWNQGRYSIDALRRNQLINYLIFPGGAVLLRVKGGPYESGAGCYTDEGWNLSGVDL